MDEVAYQNGVSAFLEGYGGVDKNPYPSGSDQADYWLAGYLSALANNHKEHAIGNSDRH